jgi:3-hydroxyisobutyrate dehydrogenase-like beta-hydroxyacid dehydrogenase
MTAATIIGLGAMAGGMADRLPGNDLPGVDDAG